MEYLYLGLFKNLIFSNFINFSGVLVDLMSDGALRYNVTQCSYYNVDEDKRYSSFKELIINPIMEKATMIKV